MTKKELKQVIKKCEEKYYPPDRKDQFTSLRCMYKDEDGEIEYIYSTENLYVCRDQDEIYWVRMKRKEFDEMVKSIKKEDVEFNYEEGNDGYADEYIADIVSVTPKYVYFTLERIDYEDV
jgi:hypothetical protein